MKIITIDCSHISGKEEFHTLMEEKLEFPCWYGKNLDALHDCLAEIFTHTRVQFVNWNHLEETLGLYAIGIRRAVTHAGSENPCIEIIFD